MTIAAVLLAALPLAALATGGAEAPAAPDPAPAAEVEPARTPWYVAFGLGSGNGVVSVVGGERTVRSLVGGDPVRIALRAGGGLTLGPKVLVGLDLAAVRATTAVQDPVVGEVRRAVQVTELDLVFTLYPAGRGLFFRGGGGLSSLALDEHAPVHLHRRYDGLNVAGGAGYAWWIGRRFNFSLDLEGSRHRLFRSAEGPRSATFWTLLAGIGWY